MAIVYSYIRFSSRKQIQGDSLRRQAEAGEGWIKKNGHVAASLTLQDLGVSAFRGKNKHRGALRTFLDAIESGQIKPGSILLVEHLDRLSRQGVSEAYSLFTAILNHGVEIAVLKPYEQIYTKTSIDDLVGLLLPLIYFYLAHLESKTKSDRLKKVWDHKREDAPNGEPFDRRCPSWVSWDEGKECFVLNEGAEAVRFIFDQTIQGLGQRQVLEKLQEKFPPIGISGNWNSSYVQKVLNDRAVLGERQPCELTEEGDRIPVGDPIPNYYPAVIDEATWFRAQASKETRKKLKGPNKAFINLFTSKIVNAVDGHTMHLQTSPHVNGGKQRRLVSYGHLSKRPGSCSLSVDYIQFERAVLTYLAELDATQLIPTDKGKAQVLATKQQELAGLDVRLRELEEQLTDPAFANLGTLARAARQLEDRRVALCDDIDRLAQELHSTPKLAETQHVLDLMAKSDKPHDFRLHLRFLLSSVLESIYVKPEKFRGRVHALVQLNFNDGGFKHLIISNDKHGMVLPNLTGPFGDAWTGFAVPMQKIKHGEAQHLPNEALLPQMDLRTEQGKQLSIISHEAEPPPIPDKIPGDVGGAAEIWLTITRHRMNPESYRVVPSKIERFVTFIGKDTPTSAINDVVWKKWIKWLRVRSGLAGPTARVTYNRSKELVRWLVAEGLTPEFSQLRKSAARAIAE